MLVLGLLLTPLALAEGGKGQVTRDASALHRGSHENATSDDHRNGTEGRRHSDDANESRGHRKGADWAAFRARFHELRESWHENATKIREECRESKPDANATKEERRDWAHCIRDGYKVWFDLFREERRAARDK